MTARKTYWTASAFALLILPFFAAPAWAGAVLDRIKADHVIHCGAVESPGLLEAEAGHATGLFVDLCRAAGEAIAGPDIRVDIHVFGADATYDPVRFGQDDLFFLSGSEIVDQHLAGRVLPGPTVFLQSTAVMVADSSSAHHVADLRGQPLCFLQGSAAHRNLEAWFAAKHLPFVRMGYQEDVELYDAFDAQACKGLAAETTTLAGLRSEGGNVRRTGRILPEPLATFPIVAGTGTSDAGWAASVAWTIATLIDADRPKAEWTAGGIDSLPIEAPELGLTSGWRKRLIERTGSYADLYRKNLGGGYSLKLPAGPNALEGETGLMLPLYAE
jgi:general L-amino acid transport system substrate-binding protein